MSTSLGLCTCGRTVSRFGYVEAVRCNGCAFLPNDCKCPPVQADVLRGELVPDMKVVYPDKLRDRVGLFMLRRGIKMGVAVDPGEVQDLIEAWEREVHPYLEQERDRYKKLAEDAINVLPNPPRFTRFKCLKCGVEGPITPQECEKHRVENKCDGTTEGIR